MFILTTLFFVCVLVVLALTVPDQAQMWPDRAKEVILPSSAGFMFNVFHFSGFPADTLGQQFGKHQARTG